MIEIEEVNHALTIAQDEASLPDNHAGAILKKLREQFPAEWKMPVLDMAITMPCGSDLAAIRNEVLLAVNAQIVEELRRRDTLTASNRAKARKSRRSKYAPMKEIAERITESRPNMQPSQLSYIILDKLQTEFGADVDLPTDRAIRSWIKEFRL